MTEREKQIFELLANPLLDLRDEKTSFEKIQNLNNRNYPPYEELGEQTKSPAELLFDKCIELKTFDLFNPKLLSYLCEQVSLNERRSFHKHHDFFGIAGCVWWRKAEELKTEEPTFYKNITRHIGNVISENSKIVMGLSWYLSGFQNYSRVGLFKHEFRTTFRGRKVYLAIIPKKEKNKEVEDIVGARTYRTLNRIGKC